MKFDVDLTTHVPIYLQLMEQVKHAISSGELEPGDQLPTVRQLAADLQVNFNTIARAYRMLDEEGIISTQHGRGTFILAPASKRASEKLRRQDLEALTQHYLEQAGKLGFASEDVLQLVETQLAAQRAQPGRPASQ